MAIAHTQTQASTTGRVQAHQLSGGAEEGVDYAGHKGAVEAKHVGQARQVSIRHALRWVGGRVAGGVGWGVNTRLVGGVEDAVCSVRCGRRVGCDQRARCLRTNPHPLPPAAGMHPP